MEPATKPRDDESRTRLLVVDPATGTIEDRTFDALPSYVGEGDVVVVNDAATLPASLPGEGMELRLVSHDPSRGTFRAVLFGPGDHRTRTEDRPPPPRVEVADVLVVGPLRARVVAIDPRSPRLIEIAFDREGAALHHALYAHGRPIQYAHVPEPIALWSVQTLYASRPWAVEMPSAGRPIRASILVALRARGAKVVPLTHAAGLSSTGDAAIDRELPLPERFEIPEETASAVRTARRVFAVGTSVVRALEGSASIFGEVRAGSGITDLRIGPTTELRVVDAVLTGMHEPGTSHFELMSAFVPDELLERIDRHAAASGYLGHEFGDATLILPPPVVHSRAWKGWSSSTASGARPPRRPSRSSIAGSSTATPSSK